MARNTTCSHMPLLTKILETFAVTRALEFGIGVFSTPLLIDKCTAVMSIEMNNNRVSDGRTWFEFVVDLVGNDFNWTPRQVLGPAAAFGVAGKLLARAPVDLILADGHGDSRAQQATFGAKRANIVVIHDAQHPHTHEKWKHSHHRIDFKGFGATHPECAGDRPWPWTTVLVKSKEMAAEVRSWLEQEEVLCGDYPWIPKKHTPPVTTPWMTTHAIQWLEEHLKTYMTVLEYGSGGSTVWFSSRAQRVWSVESNLGYMQSVRRRLDAANADNVHLAFVPPTPEGSAKYRSSDGRYYEEYVRFPRLLDRAFDLVVVDGRARDACLPEAARRVATGGVLVLDNAERRRYLAARKALKGFKKVHVSHNGTWATEIYRRG